MLLRGILVVEVREKELKISLFGLAQIINYLTSSISSG